MACTISTDAYKIQKHNVDDIISNLPEGVLLHILSLLPTKDAVRTSILAKKWKQLWTYLSAFDFNFRHPRYDLDPRNQNNTENSLLDQKNKENSLLDLVGRLLHESYRVERLCVQIFKSVIDADKVNSLIYFVAKHKMQYLKLSLGHPDDKFVLPHSFSTCESLNELWLGLHFTLHIPSGIHFPKLKTLVVSDVTFANEKSFQRLFSGCSVLQELTLHDWSWENIMHINIAISTLRELTIRFNMLSEDIHDDMTVMIDTPNLLYLRCRCDPTIQFIPVNLTSIVDADIDLGFLYPPNELYTAECAIELLSGLSNVKSLKLANDTLESLHHTKDSLHLLPLFDNLTHLDVYSVISAKTNEVLMNILQKTPKLEVLEIPAAVLNYLDGEDLILNSVPCCFNSSLNRLCFSNFYGNEYEIQFVTFILKNAPYLRKIDIHCSRRLIADIEKLDDVCNQFEDVCLESCVVMFHPSYYDDESSDDESDEDEAANSEVLPAAESL